MSANCSIEQSIDCQESAGPDRSPDIDHLIKYHPLFTATDPSKERLLFFYNSVDSLLQVGPTCGLACLAQSKRFIQPNSEPVPVDKLLAEARRMEVSNHGEMFAASSIELLGREVLGLNAATWTCLESNRNSIIERLLAGAALLIPYDADRNHEPALLNGKKAHWCICTGFGFRVQLDELSGEDAERREDELEESGDEPFLDLKRNNLSTPDLLKLLDCCTELSLFCKQGKSRLLKVFDFKRLVQSNKNLLCVDDSRDAESYRIPEEGIGQSLCNKFVVIT